MKTRATMLLSLLVLLVLAMPAHARVVLVGLDGASWNVIDPMIAAGELPNIAAIIREGVTAELETVEPVSSPVVWTSVATGRSPEHHGVTDFFSTANDIEMPTVFERLAAQGRRVGLYDYLMTWPPVQLPGGFVIPGWLRRDTRVTPRDVWQRAGIDAWTNAYTPLKTNEDYRLNALEEISSKAPRWNALFEAFDLEVGAVTFYAPDAMSHRFWHGAWPDDFSPDVAALATEAQRNALPDAMRGVDRAVGEIRARLGPDDTIVIVSDHGFRAREEPSDIWVSRFEESLPLIGLDPERDGFEILTEFGQLVIRVAPDRFERADRTTTRLARLIESCRTEEGYGLYWAAEVLDVAPRPEGQERSIWNRMRQWLVLTVLEQGFDVTLDPESHAVILALPRGGVLADLTPETIVRVDANKRPLRRVFSRQVFTGEHDPIAVFLAAGGPVATRAERGRISVLNVAPLLFYLAGSPVPDDLEGAVPEALIEPTALRERPVARVAASELPGIERLNTMGSASDPELIEKLRRLGYIE